MIERIVYSFWTPPQGGDAKNAINWHNTRSALMCSAISVLESSKRFKEVALVTDCNGYDLLINEMQLPFTDISLSLQDIDTRYSDFWSLGKVVAYNEQTKPFIHLDFDAILFKPLSTDLLTSKTFAQHTEINKAFKDLYVSQIELLKSFGFNVPRGSFGVCKSASNLGIVGFNDMDFLKEYCSRSLDFIYSNSHQWHLLTKRERAQMCVIFEQYMYDCVAKDMNVELTYLSSKTSDEDIDPELIELGYTHIWGYKRNPKVEAMLEGKFAQINKDYIAMIDYILKKR